MKRVALAELALERVVHNPEIAKRVLLRAGDVPHLVQLAQARLAPGQIAPGHAHADMWEIFFAQEGEGALAVDGAVHALPAGACIAVAPGEVHELRNPGARELVVLYLGIKA
ncbi:MAG: cupin domain-containing protein [Proteobacteria bacterium]|nr:MAG: cupin domain-containing protein [Pseudomonadota bacterium]